jgi:hypothetical protein
LLASRLPVRVRDYGACAAGGLYVGSVAGERERGRDGWVYKTAHDAPGIGAAEPSQRTRGHVLWFWCVNGADGCQRTLEVSARRLDAGTVRATVRAYDDNGEGVPASGAVVRCGGVQATAGAGGVATLSAGPECRRVAAMQSGRVRSFAAAVR